jgi:hypothetical protein
MSSPSSCSLVSFSSEDQYPTIPGHWGEGEEQPRDVRAKEVDQVEVEEDALTRRALITP